MKICGKCKQSKSLEEFCKDKSRKDGLNNRCKLCSNRYNMQWKLENPEKINRDYNRQYNKKYNKNYNRQYNKQYYQRNRKQHIAKMTKYHKENPDKAVKASTRWKNKNREQVRQYQKQYQSIKYRVDLNFRIAKTLRNRLYKVIQGIYKRGSAINDLGCSIEYFKEYIKSQFTEGMTWDNHGEWHIDHIKPLASFDLTKREELKKACHYSNLQPLWAKENIRKRNLFI